MDEVTIILTGLDELESTVIIGGKFVILTKTEKDLKKELYEVIDKYKI